MNWKTKDRLQFGGVVFLYLFFMFNLIGFLAGTFKGEICAFKTRAYYVFPAIQLGCYLSQPLDREESSDAG